jgi:hypothetical protein
VFANLQGITRREYFMELTLNETLKKGIEAHKVGQLQEADRFYTAILQAQPEHPDANHNMGVLTVSVGMPLRAWVTTNT